ncbi:MAG TPA: hypothetical protein VMR33_21285 [Candidatus Baltobacteraceae bacterium]|jgi:hypothetical protein|nr:hypothetical protein [Candidatus Baltobacteraceae bacterium]
MSNNKSVEAAENLVNIAKKIRAVECGGMPFSERDAVLAELNAAIAAYMAIPAKEPTNLGGVPLYEVAKGLAPGFIAKTLLQTGKLPENKEKK